MGTNNHLFTCFIQYLLRSLSVTIARRPFATASVYFVHGLNNVILVSVLLLDISIKSGGYSESFFNPAASLFLN